MRTVPAIIAIVAALLILAGYAYFFIISPTFVSKPQLEKPAVPLPNEAVGTEHVQWIINEMGGYKLHDSLSGEEPKIEIVVANQSFYATVNEHNVLVLKGDSEEPDIRIRASKEVVTQLLSSDNFTGDAKRLQEEGSISIEILKDEVALATKGYKALYDELMD